MPRLKYGLPITCSARTHANNPQATLQVSCNVTWNAATCDLLCLASRHDILTVLHIPDWSCMSCVMEGGLLAMVGSLSPIKSILKTVPGNGVSPSRNSVPGQPAEALFLSPLSWGMEADITWLYWKGLAGAVKHPRGPVADGRRKQSPAWAPGSADAGPCPGGWGYSTGCGAQRQTFSTGSCSLVLVSTLCPTHRWGN